MIRTIIVDDEPLGREAVCSLLAEAADFPVVDECDGGEAAIRQIKALQPDAVFLDIQMPGCDGFDVMTRLGDRMPLTVLVTAYDQFAVRAFDSYALDYVLKPVEPERFRKTLDRVRQKCRGQDAGDLRGLIDEITGRRPRPDRLMFQSAGHLVLFAPDELQWVEAAGNYVKLHGAQRECLVRQPIAETERRLDAARFVRIHRSYLVNLAAVRELRAAGRGGDPVVILCDGTKLPVSRTHLAAITARLAEMPRFGGE